MTSGWLADEDCPDCGGPLLDTSDYPAHLRLECPECAYRITYPIIVPGDKETE
jgi:hypothetical protein